jgi:hypothetical protein
MVLEQLIVLARFACRRLSSGNLRCQSNSRCGQGRSQEMASLQSSSIERRILKHFFCYCGVAAIRRRKGDMHAKA